MKGTAAARKSGEEEGESEEETGEKRGRTPRALGCRGRIGNGTKWDGNGR